MAKKILVIDVGHGGLDQGASAIHFGIRYTEYALSKDLADAIVVAAKNSEVEVVVLPTEDVYNEGGAALSNRVAFARGKKADLFLSIHWGAAGEAHAHGVQVWYPDGKNKGSADWAAALAADVSAAMGMQNRGCHLDSTHNSKRLVVLHTHLDKTKAALIELGFITNAGSVKRFQTTIHSIAAAIVKTASN